MPAQTRELLVIEDDPAISELLATTFEEIPDCNVHTVETVTQALTLLEHTPVDLITLDLVLPGEGDGNSFLHELKIRNFTTPVVVISASAPRVSTPLYPYISAVISKPFDLDYLSAVVSDSLDQAFKRLQRGYDRAEQTRLKIELSMEKLRASQELLNPPYQV